MLGPRLPYNPIKVHTRRLNKARWQSFALVLARVQYRLVGCIYTPNLCYIMTIMPLRARDIRRIFRAVGHFIQVGMYKLPTLSDSWSGRYPEGTAVTFGSAVDLRSLPWTFGSSWRPSASSTHLRAHLPTFGRRGDLRAPATFGSLGSRVAAFGQPPTSETAIPNTSIVCATYHQLLQISVVFAKFPLEFLYTRHAYSLTNWWSKLIKFVF